MYTKFIYYDDGIEVHEDSFDNPTLEKVANYIAEMLMQYDEVPSDLLKRLDGVETDKFSLFIDDDDDDVLLIESRYLGEAKVYVDDGEIILENKRYVYVEDELSGKEIEGVVYNTIKIIQDEFLNYIMQEKGDIIELLDKHEKWYVSFEDCEGPVWSATYNISSNESVVTKDEAKIIVEAFAEYLLEWGGAFEDPEFEWEFDKERNKIKMFFEYYDDGVWKEYIEFTVV